MKDELNNLDRSADDLRLGDPSRWFSSEGAESLIPHDDGLSRGALVEESFLSLVGSLPIYRAPSSARNSEDWHSR